MLLFALSQAKKAHKKASQMLMSSALKSEEEAGAIKKEVQDLEAKSAALLKQAEALADEGKDEKAELILAEAESLLEVASEMEAEAKFLNAKAAQDKESAVEAKQEEVEWDWMLRDGVGWMPLTLPPHIQ